MGAARGLTPHGVSGLKYHCRRPFPSNSVSHPTRGEWIEMRGCMKKNTNQRSHPTRGEWIEIVSVMVNPPCKVVSPHTG